MKKFLLIVIALIVIVVGGLATYVYMNLDSLMARLKPELERIASDAMKTPVKLGELHLALGLQPTIRISGVSLGDSKSQGALSVKDVLLSLDLGQLMSKELKVTKLKIEHPQITALKSEAGVKVAGLPDPTHASGEAKPAAPAPSSSGQPALPLSFALEDFSLSDGEITFEDKTRTDAFARIEIRKLDVASAFAIVDNNVKLTNAAVTTTINNVLPVSIKIPSVSLNLTSMDSAIEQMALEFLDSKVMLNTALNLTSMKGKAIANSEGIQLEKLAVLEPLIPAVKAFPLSGTVGHDVTILLSGVGQWSLTGEARLKEVGAKVNNFSVSALNGVIALEGNPLEQKASAKELALAFQGSPMKLDFAAKLKEMKAYVESFKLSAFSGSIAGNADVALSAPQIYNSAVSVSSLDINQALSALSGQPSPISGTVESVSLNLTGEVGPRLKETTGGKISFKIRDTVLKQINVAHEAFKGLLTLPLIGERIGNSIPAQFREELMAQDTRVRSISGNLSGANGLFSLNDFQLLGAFYSVDGKGTLSVAGDVKLTTKISFNKDFSTKLVAQVKEMRSALDLKGELSFPLSISGRAPNLTILPDTEGLLKLGAEAAVREGAEKLLDRALKGRGGNGSGGLGGLFGL